MNKCEHPLSARSSYHDQSVKCDDCNCVIEQYGKAIDPPSSLSPEFPASSTQLLSIRTRLAKAEAVLKIKDEFLRTRQCPDHSGKWERGRCLQCEIEQYRGFVEDLIHDVGGKIGIYTERVYVLIERHGLAGE